MKARVILISLMLLLQLGCVATQTRSETRVDGSTQETTDASLKKIFKEHSNKERCFLHAAILQIQLGDKEEQIAATGDDDALPTPLGTKIDGMNYEEILTFSKSYPTKVKPLCRA
jgi:hypothetical protein